MYTNNEGPSLFEIETETKRWESERLGHEPIRGFEGALWVSPQMARIALQSGTLDGNRNLTDWQNTIEGDRDVQLIAGLNARLQGDFDIDALSPEEQDALFAMPVSKLEGLNSNLRAGVFQEQRKSAVSESNENDSDDDDSIDISPKKLDTSVRKKDTAKADRDKKLNTKRDKNNNKVRNRLNFKTAAAQAAIMMAPAADKAEIGMLVAQGVPPAMAAAMVDDNNKTSEAEMANNEGSNAVAISEEEGKGDQLAPEFTPDGLQDKPTLSATTPAAVEIRRAKLTMNGPLF